jgi:hypothetical protein
MAPISIIKGTDLCGKPPAIRTSRAARAAALLPSVILLLAGCATSPGAAADPFPDWISRRPAEEGALFGVGSCGRTFIESRAREIAITRAAAEIYHQARGLSGHGFAFAGEGDDGTYSVSVLDNGRTVAEIDGFTVVDEFMIKDRGSGYNQGTVFVLLQLPRDRLGK